MSEAKKNRVIRTAIITENKIAWINPKIRRWPTMRYFLHTSEHGFIIMPCYMDKYLLYERHNVIWQLRTSSHQFTIEIGQIRMMPLKERIVNCIIREWNMKRTMFVIVVFFMK